VKIHGLNLDDGNLKKLQKHGVSIEIIKKFFSQEFLVLNDPKHSEKETRYIAFAQVNGRNVFVAFSIRAIEGALNFRPISARFAHDDEMEKLYEKISSQKK